MKVLVPVSGYLWTRQHTDTIAVPSTCVGSIQPLTVTLEDVCFCHWPVDAGQLTSVVPEWLTLETADGDCWVSAVAATVASVETFGRDVSRPAELLTVRTYVRGPTTDRGVRVLALFADDPRLTAVLSGLFRLPSRDGVPRLLTTRPRRRVLDRGEQRVFECQYETKGEPTGIPPDSIAGFLLDRQRYFTAGPLGTRLVGSGGQAAWRLDQIDATVVGSPLSTLDLTPLDDDPLVHHSPGVELSLAPPGPISPW